MSFIARTPLSLFTSVGFDSNKQLGRNVQFGCQFLLVPIIHASTEKTYGIHLASPVAGLIYTRARWAIEVRRRTCHAKITPWRVAFDCKDNISVEEKRTIHFTSIIEHNWANPNKISAFVAKKLLISVKLFIIGRPVLFCRGCRLSSRRGWALWDHFNWVTTVKVPKLRRSTWGKVCFPKYSACCVDWRLLL